MKIYGMLRLFWYKKRRARPDYGGGLYVQAFVASVGDPKISESA